MKHWWLRLARFAVPQWRGLLVILVLTLSSVSFNLLTPWPLKLIVDNVLRNQPLPASLQWLTDRKSVV